MTKFVPVMISPAVVLAHAAVKSQAIVPVVSTVFPESTIFASRGVKADPVAAKRALHLKVPVPPVVRQVIRAYSSQFEPDRAPVSPILEAVATTTEPAFMLIVRLAGVIAVDTVPFATIIRDVPAEK
jgi:hypothetical protein